MKEYDFGNGFMVVNNTRALDTNLQFSAPGTYIIKQKLTGITGCVTQFVDTFKVLNGINANDTIKVFYTTVLDSLSTKTIWNSMPFAVRYSINNKNTKDTFYIDPSATPNLQSQKYFIRAIDTCGNQSAVSLVAQTINLNASNQNFNEFALLEYTPYETWLNGVLEYRIEYYNKMSSQWELLSTADPGIFKYRASVSPVYKGISNSSADICYRIVAIERSGNKQVSISNTACVPVYPIVFIPTAFSPNNDGLNDYYKPSYAGLNVYTFEIYDRWGQMVYSDSFDSKGWDGTFRGKPAEAGAYVYRLSAVGYLKSQDNNDSRFVERKGTLFLIR